METQEQPKTKKVKPKIQIDLSNIENATEVVSDVYSKVNQKDFGKNINLGQIFVYALGKLNEDDIQKIQELSMTPEDALRKKHKEYILKTGENIDFFEFISRNLKPIRH